MRLAFTFFFFFIVFSSCAQVKGEFSVGALQSVGTNKYRNISSSTQSVGVLVNTSKRYNKVGLRVRFVLLKSLTDRLSVALQSGFTLRRNEELWGERFNYISVPIQGGGSYKLLKKNHAVLSISAFSGINVFKIQTRLAKQYSGFIQNGELSYLFIKHGFLKSIIVKAGYEFQIDNEIFFYTPSDPSSHEEEFHYKIRRNQIYLAFGLGL